MSGFSALIDPLTSVAALGVIMLICRWVFGTGHRDRRPAAQQPEADLGLLVPVATVTTRAEAQVLRDLLQQAGVRSGVSESAPQVQVLVFEEDLARARELVEAV